MEFGVGYFPTHDGSRPGEIARRVEERGQTALYFAEHTHIRIPALRARADRHLDFQVLSVPPDPKALEQLEAAGVRRASCWLPSGPWSVVEPALEKWERAIADLTGR